MLLLNIYYKEEIPMNTVDSLFRYLKKVGIVTFQEFIDKNPQFRKNAMKDLQFQ